MSKCDVQPNVRFPIRRLVLQAVTECLIQIEDEQFGETRFLELQLNLSPFDLLNWNDGLLLQIVDALVDMDGQLSIFRTFQVKIFCHRGIKGRRY